MKLSAVCLKEFFATIYGEIVQYTGGHIQEGDKIMTLCHLRLELCETALVMGELKLKHLTR